MCSHDGPLAHAAHIALPACSWAEAPGTYVNKDGVRQRTDAVLEPMGETYPAWEMIVALGRTMGYAFEWNDRTDLLSALDSAMRAAQAAGDDDEGGAEAAPKEVSP